MSIQVQIAGRLTRDAEMVEVEAGNIVKFCIATDRPPMKKGGERDTDFFDVSGFVGKDDESGLMEKRVPHLKKGLKVCIIEGATLMIRKWEDKEGNKRYSPEVRVRSLWSLEYDPKSLQQEDEDIPF